MAGAECPVDGGPMLIRHLPYFVVAAEEQNLAKAAVRLGVSASALTRRIQNLEHELGGVQLFERRQSGISLTAAGREFLADIEAPLEQLGRAAKRAERVTKGQAGALRVGFNPIARRQPALRDAFDQFQANYPDISLQLVPMMSRHQADALLAGDLDIGILSVPFAEAGFGVEQVEEFPMLLTLNKDHPKADKDDLTLGDLEDEAFVGITREWIPSVYDNIASQFERAGMHQKIICETHCDATITNLIALGVGVGFVTPADKSVPSDRLRQREIDGFSASLPLSLVWRDRGDAKIRKLVQTVGDSLGHQAAVSAS